MWDCCSVFQLGNEVSIYIRAHYSREKLHRPWDEMGRKRFVTARLVQELLCLQGQISMGMAWEAACWGLKWQEKRLCLYNTISRETNGVKRGWIWIKSPINVHFALVWVLHIQLKLSEAVSPDRVVMTSHPEQNCIRCWKWEGSRWVGSMTGDQSTIFNNSQLKRGKGPAKKHWADSPFDFQIQQFANSTSKGRKKLKRYIWEHCEYWPLCLS